MSRRIAIFLLLFMPVAAGCRREAKPAAAPPAPTVPVQFADITEAAGIQFVHNNGAVGGKWLPETMGSGCAFIDYDNDGHPDIFLVNSRDWTPEELRRGKSAHPSRSRRPATSALYHNRGDGTFEDVTQKAGLAVEA